MYPGKESPEIFRGSLRAFPSVFASTDAKINSGSRVILPPTCLQKLSTMRVAYPLQFKLRNGKRGVTCYAGVLEFSAEEGHIVMPAWMFTAMGLCEGSTVAIETCTLPPGGLIKLRPQESNFLQLSNPKNVLEMRLSDYPVLTKGTSIVLDYLDRDFVIDVISITDDTGKSVDAISTVRADTQATELKVEFERPLDMPPSPTESERQMPQGGNIIGADDAVEFAPFVLQPPTIGNQPQPARTKQPKEEAKAAFVPFMGVGRRIDGKSTVEEKSDTGGHRVAKTQEEMAQEAREMRLKAFGRFNAAKN
ncbi:ubiquitin fusion degradation protein, putative [Trypanosoma equiperdum]|uniref:Ubiquitin fusion degradation protein, putative n=2 Tax=Trypanozoon TaxID=39700 RepID=Q38AI5_TRYB2|nr:ubiquitin fusion degradation protein, putative [Trypanosoma brucei brucei TREU927]EAN78185.1 ubiquitin fusion degradation protein, putative [Trypanosoma brucei brucei TREU927]SCU65513.1 ubiquitin fusion degradation protein, putative [Trypanosoma equiperdum]